MEGNNIGLITQQGEPCTKKKKKLFVKKADFPYKAKKLFGLEEDKKNEKK